MHPVKNSCIDLDFHHIKNNYYICHANNYSVHFFLGVIVIQKRLEIRLNDPLATPPKSSGKVPTPADRNAGHIKIK